MKGIVLGVMATLTIEEPTMTPATFPSVILQAGGIPASPPQM